MESPQKGREIKRLKSPNFIENEEAAQGSLNYEDRWDNRKTKEYLKFFLCF